MPVNRTFKHALSLLALILAAGCAGKKPITLLTQENLQDKRVAVAEIDGPKEARKHVEVALANEIIEHGRFQIIDRTTVNDAKVTYPDRSDWKRLGEKVGADYVLGVKILDFSIKEREGYDSVEEEDSLLTEEAKSDEPIVGKRYVKVKGDAGSVRLKMSFYDVAQGKMLQEGVGQASDNLNTRDGNIRKMDFLESLTAQAVQNFFDSLPKN